MRPAPHGYVPGDPGTTWDIAATEIIAERKRAFFLPRLTSTIRISDPATASQILAKYGLTRATAKVRTRLLAKARKGDPEARRRLRQVYGVTVFQQPEIRAFQEMVEAWER